MNRMTMHTYTEADCVKWMCLWPKKTDTEGVKKSERNCVKLNGLSGRAYFRKNADKSVYLFLGGNNANFYIT